MAMIWTEDWNTGIEIIDEQHQRIVDYINALEDAMVEQRHHLVGTVLDALVDYTQSHFTFEESLQKEAHYELAAPHKAMHDIFIKRLERYQSHHHAGQDIAKALHSMLTFWLVHHIKSDDADYVVAVRQNMLHLISDPHEDGWLKRSLRRFFG